VRLICSYKQDPAENEYDSDSHEFVIPAKSSIEVILKTTPQRQGLFSIDKVEWVLLGQFKSQMLFQNDPKLPRQLELKQKTF
jgi:hypothetical protein